MLYLEGPEAWQDDWRNARDVRKRSTGMPLYEYYCKDCRSKFELLTTYTESEVDVECARCHGANVRKLISVFARTRSANSGFGGDFAADAGDDFGDDGEGSGGCCGGSCGCHD
jgi:putative FmdB family regulatory protein